MARPKSQMNADSPSAANGTNRAETSPRSVFEHSIEPAPTPTEKNVSISVNTGASASMPRRTSVGSSASMVAPITQNQLKPSRHSQTWRLARAEASSSPVSRSTFQPMRRPAAWHGARGTSMALATPPTAITRPATETITAPCGSTNSALPAMVPARMPTNVPASTSPLPATSSRAPRWLGRMPYLSGLKNVACTPSPNSTANSSGVLSSRNPAAASAISGISTSFTITMVRDFSNRSANCPAVAESST